MAAAPTACTPPGPPTPVAVRPSPATLTITAEWRHIEPAMEIAARRAELAIVQQHIRPGEKRFELQSIRAEPGWLIARPDTNAPFHDDASIPIRLEASIGLFGNPSAEHKLLLALADRLAQLRGREWAPVR